MDERVLKAIKQASVVAAEHGKQLREGKLDYEIFHMGDLKLQEGFTLPNAKLAYKTYGNKSNPAIVYPSWYSGTHVDCEWLIGPGLTLDPTKYFIILTNAFGNGLSSSPSNQPAPYNGPRFPKVTLYDNVTAQHRLVTEHLGITKIFAVLGWSMGAQQTYQWGALYSDMIEYIVPFCGSAKTSVHNFVFLEGPASALRADGAFKEGWYKPDEIPTKGLRAFARVYAGWGFSQAFYRQKIYLDLGFASLEDPNNLLCMLWTWQNADISNNPKFNGDFNAALKAIKCKAMVMPGMTDLYFPPEDSQMEVDAIGKVNAVFVPFESVWGHWAGGPGTNPVDVYFLNEKLGQFFANKLI
ncbi:hypothetical protein HDU76_010082 [Blyttiomyces sp. JEL0837]|nr:hypothetical protein HDU76_010082 [Blyttiomyces sp. JEL0837]